MSKHNGRNLPPKTQTEVAIEEIAITPAEEVVIQPAEIANVQPKVITLEDVEATTIPHGTGPVAEVDVDVIVDALQHHSVLKATLWIWYYSASEKLGKLWASIKRKLGFIASAICVLLVSAVIATLAIIGASTFTLNIDARTLFTAYSYNVTIMDILQLLTTILIIIIVTMIAVNILQTEAHREQRTLVTDPPF
jgi:hypothetical protein